MNHASAIVEEPEPDIVSIMLARVIAMAPGFSAALAEQIEREVRATHGGKRLFVAKGAFKRLTPAQREAVFRDGLTGMGNKEIITKHKISRATLYREMKKGGRFSPE